MIGDGLSVTRFLRFPLVTLASMSLKRPSASDFWASPTVIGDGLSVTRFLRFPLVTLASISLKRPSASDFWASPTVIGDGLSVTRFLRFPLVTLASISLKRPSASDFWASPTDWGWLVGDKVLEVSSGDVGVHKLEKSVGIGFHLVKLDESLSDWSISVLDKGNKGLLGDVLTVELTNVNWGLGLLLGPLWSLVLNGVISIIIREALIDDLGKSLSSIEGLSWWWGVGLLWVSLDHDGHGDVVVVGHILGLLSGSVEDGVEGVVTNNLSEGFEGNGLNGVKTVEGVDGEVDSLDLIDWDINEGSVG